MDKSTGSFPEFAEEIYVYCGECRRKSWSIGGPGHSQLLGILARIGETPVFWLHERFSDRIELGAPLTHGIHPRGGYEALGDLKDEVVTEMGYPSRAMFERDAERVAELATEGVRAFDIWSDVVGPDIALQRLPGFDTELFARLVQDPQLRARIWNRPNGKPTRLAMTSVANGIRVSCRAGHDVRVSLKRLVAVLSELAEGEGKLFIR